MAALSNKKRFFSRPIIPAIVTAALVMMLAACAPYQARRAPLNFHEKGEASWYGPGFAGHKTASGEKFSPEAMTAAHRTLPLGTTLKVMNTENGKACVVRINDRGPFVAGRILDLSHRAAQRLGIVGTGTAEVELFALAGPADHARETAGRSKNHAKDSDDSNAQSSGDEGLADSSGVAYLISKEHKDGNPPPEIDEPEPAKETKSQKQRHSKSKIVEPSAESQESQPASETGDF